VIPTPTFDGDTIAARAYSFPATDKLFTAGVRALIGGSWSGRKPDCSMRTSVPPLIATNVQTHAGAGANPGDCFARTSIHAS
jgi:hypothetical protein